MADWTTKFNNITTIDASHINDLQDGKVDSDGTAEPTFANVKLGDATVGTSGTNVISLRTGTTPSSSPADCAQFYSKDVSAGNAAPHFRLEGGEEVSLRASGYYVDGDLIAGGGETGPTGAPGNNQRPS